MGYRARSSDDAQPAREHFFAGCVDSISRFFFDKRLLCSRLDGTVEDAIDPDVKFYVQELLKSLTTMLSRASHLADPRASWRLASGLDDSGLDEFLFGVDDA